ncbi:hypothetical protein W97_01459 [Coniosporium apollinis CBS 100218]|uniref:Protein BNI4 n=1 Tax=Coniosporium apollinis (strain CBS 100218) TaxID=1168221 RepID=R7YK34_CONA1|nr:uncharacterized protein W97_01459 [Coniosporium apollinis CBS 100218]EON62238.1 hypothetical protein W97_01459 [Coniosporium apollinis CBS 100218]
MAEVLTPIIPQTSTITMLHTSPDPFQTSSSPQGHHQSSRASQMSRSHIYNTQSGAMGSYRPTAAAPVATYAFQTTPHLRQDNRTTSAPAHPYAQQNGPTLSHRPGQPSSSSNSTNSSSSSSNKSLGRNVVSKDDSVLSSHQRSYAGAENRPLSTVSLSTSVPDLSLSTFDLPSKPSPDRYRRVPRRSDSSPTLQQHEQFQSGRSAVPSGSGMATVAHLYQGAVPINTANRPSHQRTGSADETQASRASEQAKRYRRRSMTGIESGDASSGAVTTNTSSGTAWRSPSPSGQNMQANKPSTPANRPVSHHPHTSSGDARPSTAAARPASSRQSSSGSITQQAMAAGKPELKIVNIPARGSSEASKRPVAPSPLSRPVVGTEPERAQPILSRLRTEATSEIAPSPAAQHLAAVNDKDTKEGMKSRLRRAFSFGSAAELRKASAENSFSAERARLRKEKYQHEREAEQEAIAAKQEAGGIGAGIYSGQGNYFGGSTDNLSIQSTASSASIMLRKMGQGMKKSSRSLKGLFRPKSVIGVPAADGPVTRPSAAEVSIVTVEAEREKVNVNIDPHDQAGGGTGFPRLERNSLDANSVASREVPGLSTGPPSDTWSRKSIVGGERERAEVLAAVKKGILKRSATSSGSSSPVVRPADNSLPTMQITDTPNSSSPATPVDDQPAPLTQDYFVGAQRFATTSSRSLPNTPHGGPRNISFSPRIQFHDAWSATEYDRRGDIATCNRLTPMLAQQIKEELNSFKMEMEVHELSKPHTHFF